MESCIENDIEELQNCIKTCDCTISNYNLSKDYRLFQSSVFAKGLKEVCKDRIRELKTNNNPKKGLIVKIIERWK